MNQYGGYRMNTVNAEYKVTFAFTLLELMVVVAIIMILTSIMLPSISRAKDTVKTIACGSNLKQIGLAQTTYSQDFNDWIVAGADETPRYWYNFLSGVDNNGSSNPSIGSYGLKYYGQNRTAGSFVCPAESTAFGSNSSINYFYTHYAINSRIAGIASWGSTNENYYRRKVTAITGPSIAILASDNIRKNDMHVNYPAFPAYRHGGTDPRNNPVDLTGVAALKGYANVAYMDGHINKKKYNDLNYPSVSYYYFELGFLKNGVPFH